MALSPDDEARGLKAYEQVRAFVRLRSWRLPVTLTVCPFVALLTGVWTWAVHYHLLGGVNFGLALFLAWMAQRRWKHLQAQYARNVRLLKQLESEYGDALPWVKVENHFAALEKLKRELAEESSTRL